MTVYSKIPAVSIMGSKRLVCVSEYTLNQDTINELNQALNAKTTLIPQ